MNKCSLLKMAIDFTVIYYSVDFLFSIKCSYVLIGNRQNLLEKKGNPLEQRKGYATYDKNLKHDSVKGILPGLHYICSSLNS